MAAGGGSRKRGFVSTGVYGASDVHRDKQYVIFPADRAADRVQARWLAMLEFGVQRPASVEILETTRFEDRRGATGWTVWVRVA